QTAHAVRLHSRLTNLKKPLQISKLSITFGSPTIMALRLLSGRSHSYLSERGSDHGDGERRVRQIQRQSGVGLAPRVIPDGIQMIWTCLTCERLLQAAGQRPSAFSA